MCIEWTWYSKGCSRVCNKRYVVCYGCLGCELLTVPFLRSLHSVEVEGWVGNSTPKEWVNPCIRKPWSSWPEGKSMLRKQIVSLPHKMHQTFNPKQNYTTILLLTKLCYTLHPLNLPKTAWLLTHRVCGDTIYATEYIYINTCRSYFVTVTWDVRLGDAFWYMR